MNRPADPTTWTRHIEGWPTGAFFVLCAAFTAALVTPIAIGTIALPLPQINRLEQMASLQRDRQLAVEALAGLPFSVEQVGLALRRTGAHDAEKTSSPTQHRQLHRLALVARKRYGDTPLLKLRALQLQKFLHASRALLRMPDDPAARFQLAALGGQLVNQGRKRGWFGGTGFLGDERTLAVLFKIHWAHATRLVDSHPFAPSLTDWKIYYRFLLSSLPPAGVKPAVETRLKLKQVAELQRHDDDYPWLLAQGILLRRLDDAPRAAVALTAHRKARPNGQWSLLARNQLAGCASGIPR